jgi:hypothetical protein
MLNRRLPLHFLLIPLAALQPSCNEPKSDFFGPKFEEQLREAFEQAMRELWTDDEYSFLKLAMKSMLKQVKEQERRGPCVIRHGEVCFTHPRAKFPSDRPDGVWMINMGNLVPPDERFVREPVGKEIRLGQSESTVRQVSVYARHRGDGQALVGELEATGEQIVDVDGQVQYRVFTVRIAGRYDEQTGEWTLTAESLTPVGVHSSLR